MLFFFYLLVYRFQKKKCFIFHFMYFLKILFKKKNIKKYDYFTAVLYKGDVCCRLFQLIVGTSNSLKKRAKVFVINLNTEKKNLK